MTVADLLAARRDDPRPGLVHATDGRRWTWAAVVAESARRARWLAARAAPGRPAHVGVLLDNDPETVFLLGGAALSGAVVVALNPARSPDEIQADAERADCDLVVASARHAARLASRARPPVVLLDDHVAALPEDGPDTAVPVTDTTLLMLIFTSGTSGDPRAVRVTHRKVEVPGAVLADRLLTPDDVVYCPMPLFHSGAIMAALAPALAAGACLVIRPRFSASGLLRDVRAHGCTYLHYVGKALSYALATEPTPDDAANPLRVAFGNEAAPAEQDAFARRFGCHVIDAYGSSETAISFAPGPDTPRGSLGRLTPGVAILNADGEPCPPAAFDAHGRLTNAADAVGELVARDHGLFDGYYRDDAPDRLRDGAFHSGDLAYRDADGHVYFAGRAADRLRVDGENLAPVPIERALAGLPGVRRLAVYGVPDQASGDQVMVALVTDAFDPDAFAAHLRGRRDLAPVAMPRYVRITAELPMTASGKVLGRVLAAERWHTADPVWWRPGRDLAYRRMTPEDRAALAAGFARRGRSSLLEGNR
ncbi:AMP-binding protein [Actinomadura flavalba]|uniref:AMP-binding protein n=1 Tax=Actinomadura flavalba TaxID=1120938 RepID=UPI0003628647|nr:AMP-binding protein [Actinomadura flavalba]